MSVVLFNRTIAPTTAVGAKVALTGITGKNVVLRTGSPGVFLFQAVAAIPSGLRLKVSLSGVSKTAVLPQISVNPTLSSVASLHTTESVSKQVAARVSSSAALHTLESLAVTIPQTKTASG